MGLIWVDLVTLLAIVQFFGFAYAVGIARGRYHVHAPATTGHEIFERYFRVQQNTLELLVMFIPSLWLAARYWFPTYVAAIGALYLLGRLWYFITYVRDPRSRTVGFMLSFLPIAAFWVIAGIGIVLALVRG